MVQYGKEKDRNVENPESYGCGPIDLYDVVDIRMYKTNDRLQTLDHEAV